LDPGTIPPESDWRWREVLTGTRDVAFEYLAIRMFVTAARLEAARDTTGATLARKCGEFRNLLVASARHPKVQADLRRIFP
jgi:hypothetical protein